MERDKDKIGKIMQLASSLVLQIKQTREEKEIINVDKRWRLKLFKSAPSAHCYK